MNFEEFQVRRKQLLVQRPGLQDCAESNVYRALSCLVPDLAAAFAMPTETVHRCHLAEQWTNHFAVPAADPARALVSCGVRHSLEMIFRLGASQGDRFWLPADNYPVYLALAAEAGAQVNLYPTLPEPIWPTAEGHEVDGADRRHEFLLITNPMKPRSRWLNEADLTAIEDWLSGGDRRRVLIDAVYDLGEKLHAGTLRLLAEGKTILLHSLTKGWLHPRLFGVALVPECDRERWLPVFRSAAPPQQNLAMARELLAEHFDLPQRVAVTLGATGDALFHNLPVSRDQRLATDAPGYLFPVKVAHGELLEKGVLGMPASVFGSDRNDLTVLSSLSLVAQL